MLGVSEPLATEYGAAIGVMKEMGWSWADLRDAPHDLVQELIIRLSAESEWTNKRQKMDAAKKGGNGKPATQQSKSKRGRGRR